MRPAKAAFGIADTSKEKQFFERTLEVWQPRTPKLLGREDARLITENATGFFKILLEWEAAELHTPGQLAKDKTDTDSHAAGSRPG